jgi:hypothetical protein
MRQGMIKAFVYHLISIYGFGGYDLGLCLPSDVILSALLGRIQAFAYPLISFFLLCWIGFRLLLTL